MSLQKAQARRERKNAKKRVSNMTEEQRQRERERKRTCRMSADRVARERQRKRVSSMTEEQIEKQRARKRSKKKQDGDESNPNNPVYSEVLGDELLLKSTA
ncbi:hypothetical protein EON65_12875 [archaeon]|nr:MAG: hypothetical protein EON65_12875 [archaeon]